VTVSQKPGKHSPSRLDTYLTVHENIMDQFRRSDFVGDDTLTVDDFSPAGFYVIQGEIACQGNIVITVYKILDIVVSGEVPEVRTSRYSYNVRVLGKHNVFRYDNCHAHQGHPDEHHKDVFDFVTGDRVDSQWVGEQGWPTLGEVIEEARSWWSDNRDKLPCPDCYPRPADLESNIRGAPTSEPGDRAG
jgi:hypothetical protein